MNFIRYFLISYYVNTGIFGQIAFSSEKFPSYIVIKRKIKENFPETYNKSLIILNIYEFDDVDDYDSFKGEE